MWHITHHYKININITFLRLLIYYLDMKAKISLDQWHALIAVVDEGGYAAAAESMNKSQSAVSYAIQKMETELSLRVFRLEGRRSVLTPVGKTLYKRAKHLLEDAFLLEEAGQKLAAGAEAKVSIAVDTLYPARPLLEAIAACSLQHPATQFEIHEATLSGPNEALLSGKADIAISAFAPPGMLGEACAQIDMIAVASKQHPLHQLGREITWDDLRKHRQLVVRDSGQKENRDAGWLGAEQRLTVSQGATAVEALNMSLAYCWLPAGLYEQLHGDSRIAPLPLKQGRIRKVDLSLYYADSDYAGPATRFIGERLLQKQHKH